MRRRRAGYTLLEVLVSLAIAVMLLAAVYSVIGYQLRQAQAGRDLIEQATLARAILQKIDADVRSTISLGDPARFRRQPESTQSGMSGSGGGMGATSPGMTTTGATTGSGTGTSTTAPTTTASSGMTGTDPAASSMTTADPASTTQPVALPLGVIGGANELHLFASKFPNEAFGAEEGQVSCDIRRVSWWVGEGDVGLCRAEARLVTSDDVATASVPSGDPTQYQLAPEARSLDILYFDGSSWVDSWDSTELGPDQLTPKGSPRAIKIRVGIARPNNPDELKYHTRVILIPTAGGAPPATVPMTAEEAATSTTSP